jgi:predicted dehydrogenase
VSEAPGEVRLGVIGVGGMGQHHARVGANVPGARLAGLYDVDPERAREVATRHGTRAFARLRDLLPEVDAVCVAVPTVDHLRVVRAVLEAGKDVLVEKPMAASLGEADEMIALAEAKGALLQVGHVERFNPAVDVLRTVSGARFIEVHRLGSFSPRSLDIDVVLDLMIHDLDIVLSLDGTEAVQVDAVGVPVLTPRVDIANARLRFASGLIANLTASRVSTDRVRKFRIFAPRTYVSADLAAREVRVHRLGGVGSDGWPAIRIERTEAPPVPQSEPLWRQVQAFVQAIRGRTRPVVGGADGRRALALAGEILTRIGGKEPS